MALTECTYSKTRFSRFRKLGNGPAMFASVMTLCACEYSPQIKLIRYILTTATGLTFAESPSGSCLDQSCSNAFITNVNFDRTHYSDREPLTKSLVGRCCSTLLEARRGRFHQGTWEYKT